MAGPTYLWNISCVKWSCSGWPAALLLSVCENSWRTYIKKIVGQRIIWNAYIQIWLPIYQSSWSTETYKIDTT